MQLLYYCRSERNIIEAAANGALDTIYIIASIMVNLIAFLSILELVNLTLKWFGERNGLEPPYIDDNLTFQVTFQFAIKYNPYFKADEIEIGMISSATNLFVYFYFDELDD